MKRGRALAEEHDDHEEHIDERWLVSYADMMTLLFGLFVMLFSIASEKTGNFNEQLREISRSTTLTQNEPDIKPAAPVVSQVPNLPTPPPVEEILSQLEIMRSENSRANIEKVELTQKVADLEAAIERVKKDREEMDARRTPASVPSKQEIAAAKREAEQLKKQLAEEKEKRLKIEDSTAEVANLKKQLAEEKARLKAIAAEPKKKDEPAKPVVDVKDLERKIAEAKERTEIVEKEKKELEEDMKKKTEELEAKIEKLEKNAPSSRRFMMVVLKWSTEKHDLDLTVTDPNGKSFNFKKRRHAGRPGEFTIDSRTGPGAEIWQTEQLIPGTYTVSWKLYNDYGNAEPVVYSGVVSSNASKIEIPETQMPAKVGSQRTLKFQVDAEGRLNKI